MQCTGVRTRSQIIGCMSTAINKHHFTRRQILQNAVLSCTPFLPAPARGSSTASTLESYTDPTRNFSLSYPASWVALEGSVEDGDYGTDRLMAWHPKDASPESVNVTLIVTNASADFTTLGSFGSAENFGTNLVNSMDRSYMKRAFGRRPDDVQTARLLDAKSVNGMYRIEYLLRKPADHEKRFISLMALRFDGIYNRLFTLTSQCYEAEFNQYESQIQTFLDSFQPPGKV